MLDYHLDKTSGVLTLEPKGPLTVSDFTALTAEVDGYLATHKSLVGLLLSVEHLPGWESFAALVQHIKFVRDHHKRVERIAVLTDDSLVKIAPEIAAHFAHPEFRVFSSSDRAGAVNWLQSP